MLGHEEIRTIISATGPRVSEWMNLTSANAAYGKIVLMTDADVDARLTSERLLLTFFFRQMPELIETNAFISPSAPLYEVKRKGVRDSEYILNESQMHKNTENAGWKERLDHSRGADGLPAQWFDQGKLALLVKLLNDAERSIRILQRRGVVFKEFVEQYFDGCRLPAWQVRMQGQNEFFYDKETLRTPTGRNPPSQRDPGRCPKRRHLPVRRASRGIPP
jgi:DNA gyrase subunit B